MTFADLVGVEEDAQVLRGPRREVRVRPSWRGVDHTRLYEVLDPSGRPIPGPRVAVVAHIHGNEPVGMHAHARFAEEVVDRLLCGSVLLVVANPAAAANNERHTPDGRDMNRLWDRWNLQRVASAHDGELVYEERRVRELAPLILACDAIMDLHSTSRPSNPHLVFRDDLRHADIAARLGVARLVTGVHEGGILDGGLCSNIGLAAGEDGERLGFTLEAGQYTQRENDEAAWMVVVRLLQALEMWSGEPPARTLDYEVYEVQGRFRQAPRGAEPYRFVGYEGGEPGGGRFAAPRKLESFELVEADEVMLRRGSTEVVRSKGTFTMLMPAPTAGPGDDLFYFAQRRHAALRTRPRTHEAARLEAEAIERVLDLLAHDGAERGTCQVTFTPRRTLDACAEMILRVRRLPPDHPHRRIAVVGRGDWERDERERRAAVRYQTAMQRAIDGGVPVDRMQLLRGASFAWLRHLTSGDLAIDEGGMRLFLSLTQPHTVAVLATGDLELALREGDFRHVCVGLVIEAPTVEPDGITARTRVARTGLFGARPELVESARAFVAALKREHQQLLDATPWGARLRDAHLTVEDGALCATDETQLGVLREVLIDLQGQTWRESLAHVVTRPALLEDDEAVGRWLARVMSTTGILDAEMLRRMVLRADGTGWRVDPQGVRDAIPWREMAEEPAPDLPMVLEARDVDRENIERWIGWKRFVQDVESVPGDRGKDVDLAFTTHAVQERMARWYRDARHRGLAEPGQWMLVVAGDGWSPGQEADPDSLDALAAHWAVLREPAVHYRRIQHAQGGHLSWVKAWIDQLSRRPAGGAPIVLGWEAEHGSTINVVLLARKEDTANDTGWSLEGWSLERCAVILSELDASGDDENQVALWTERTATGQVNQELLAFGRAHCEGLLRQASWRTAGHPGPALRMSLERTVVQLVTEWVGRARQVGPEVLGMPEEARVDWLARRLGLADRVVVARLLACLGGDEDEALVARRIWRDIEAWPRS